MRLIDHPQFKEDYERYSKAISNISDIDQKNKLTILLNQFVNEVKTIDRGHEDLIMQGRLPESLLESKRKLVSLRKSLDTSLSLPRKSTS
jgi:hypothetical protein